MASSMLRSQSGAPSDWDRAEQSKKGRVASKATDYKMVPMDQNGAEQPKERLVAREAPESHEAGA